MIRKVIQRQDGSVVLVQQPDGLRVRIHGARAEQEVDASAWKDLRKNIKNNAKLKEIAGDLLRENNRPSKGK